MNKQEKEIIQQFPNATDRKRVKGYNYQDYYGEMPDSPEFEERTKKDAWVIILINVIFIGAMIVAAVYCSTKFQS